MTPVQLLTGQILALERSLGRAQASLSKQNGSVGSKLLKKVRGRFDNDLLGLRNRCGSLREKVSQGASPEVGWNQLGALQRESSDLLPECLAFLEGALVRDNKLDNGVCALADSMLYGLSDKTDMVWRRFTLVAAGEFFSTISGIVRLRFTDSDIWNLPVAAHEFGHFVSAQPKFIEFTQLAAAEKVRDPRYPSHLGELFSDLFATYALGPSYLLNCVLLRFSPAGAHQESNTHPSNAQRVWWMLETLAKMDAGENGPPAYQAVADQVRKLWGDALQAAGEQQAIPETDASRLRGWLADLYDLVNSRIPSVRYERILRSQELAQWFRADGPPDPRDDDEIPEVLNAAWLYRMNAGAADFYQLDQLAAKALGMCHTIASRES